MRQSVFVEKSHIAPKLIRAVARQVGSWESFTECAEDIQNHGASGGTGGFIYYNETVPFYRKNRKEILELAELLAMDLGEDLLAMVAGFNCLKQYGFSPSEIAQALYASKGAMVDQIQNAMAWFALEEVARSYCDCVESQTV